jgi:hypothetical protein
MLARNVERSGAGEVTVRVRCCFAIGKRSILSFDRQVSINLADVAMKNGDFVDTNPKLRLAG